MDDVSKIVEVIKKKVKEADVSVAQEREINEWYRSGVLAVDWVLGGKGFPGGRVVELYGDYGSGKSYLGYKVIAEAQRDGKVGVLIDTEESYNRSLLERAGVDTDKLVVVRNVTIEEGFEAVKEIVKNVDVPAAVVWDSLAATPTEHELAEGVDTRDLSRAMVVGKGLRYVVSDIADKDCLLLILNQVREKIGVMYGDKTFAPGGRAVGFHSSVRLEAGIVRKIVDDETVVGYDIRFKVVKSRVAEPFREVVLQLRWDRGDLLPWWEGLFGVLIKLGYIEDGKGWYCFKGEEKKWRAGDFLEQIVGNEVALSLLREVFGENFEKYCKI